MGQEATEHELSGLQAERAAVLRELAQLEGQGAATAALSDVRERLLTINIRIVALTGR